MRIIPSPPLTRGRGAESRLSAGAGAAAPRSVREALPACGILSSLLYVATDILGALRWQGYSYTAQTISELSAIDAPSRPLVGPLFLTYSVLVVAVGLGVWRAAGGKRPLRTVAGLLIGFGLVDTAGRLADLIAPFSAMHRREVLAAGGATLTDSVHIIWTLVDSLFILLIIGFGARAFGRRFRLYSIATILILVVFGALAGMEGPRVAENLPTPWAGLTERVNVYGAMLWFAVLATALLRVPVEADRDGAGRSVSA